MKDSLYNVTSDFQSFLRLERSLSENTISSYLSDIKKLFLFCGERCSAPENISSELIASFLEAQKELGISKRTQARILSSVKALFKYFEIEGRIENNPCDLLDAPKMGNYLPSVLSIDEISSIISVIDLSVPQGHRNLAIIETLYSSGLRVSELVNLKISDLFFEDSFIRVIGKGDKQRLVPIGEPAMAAITHYLAQSQITRGAKQSEDIVFLNRRGSKLTREMIFLIVRKYAEQAGITKDISPHTFRHSFASHLIENGADLRVVQEMLGHESILTTEIYTHIDTQKWQKTIINHHPRR